jgi:hypothetical protein
MHSKKTEDCGILIYIVMLNICKIPYITDYNYLYLNVLSAASTTGTLQLLFHSYRDKMTLGTI